MGLVFNWDKNVYKSFLKENNKVIYINTHFNHPLSTLRKLPKSIEKWVSETLSDKDIFDKLIKTYNGGLKESGFKDELNYAPPESESESEQGKGKRKGKVIWSNPPYSRTVKTNIGKTFSRLLSKYFLPAHNL